MTSSRRHQRPRCPPASSSSPVTPLMRVRRRVRQDTLSHRGLKDPSKIQLLRASRDRLTKRQQNDSARPPRQMRRISVYRVAYLLTQQIARGLPSRHTRPRPTPGRTSSAPTMSTSRNRPTGPDPTQMEGCTRRLLRHPSEPTPPEAINGIRLGRRTTFRGHRNPPTTNSEDAPHPQEA